MGDKITFTIKPFLKLQGEVLTLWNDPKYSQITISSPDILEKSLIEAVETGRAEEALDWYLETHPIPIRQRLCRLLETAQRFPERYQRYSLISEIK